MQDDRRDNNKRKKKVAIKRHNNQCFDTNHRMTAGQEVWIDVTELPRRKKQEKI